MSYAENSKALLDIIFFSLVQDEKKNRTVKCKLVQATLQPPDEYLSSLLFFCTDQQDKGLFLLLACGKCPYFFYRIQGSVTLLALAQRGFLPAFFNLTAEWKEKNLHRQKNLLPQLIAYILLTKCKTNAHSDSEIKKYFFNFNPSFLYFSLCFRLCIGKTRTGHAETTSKVSKTQLLFWFSS